MGYIYDKKVGDKEKIKKKWDKLKIDIQVKIIDHIEKYKLSQPDKKYRKNPETYLNQKSWNDEIIESIEPAKRYFDNNKNNKPPVYQEEGISYEDIDTA